MRAKNDNRDFPGFVQELLDLSAQLRECGGVVAMEDELAGEGVVRAGPKLWVSAACVSVLGQPEDLAKATPTLCFNISDEARRPLHHCGIDKEVAVDALQFAPPTMQQARVPAPAFEAEPAAAHMIRRGASRLLTMAMVTLDDPRHLENYEAGAGIRFEIADERYRPLYSFTMNWPLAFLLVNLA